MARAYLEEDIEEKDASKVKISRKGHSNVSKKRKYFVWFNLLLPGLGTLLSQSGRRNRGIWQLILYFIGLIIPHLGLLMSVAWIWGVIDIIIILREK